MQHLIYVLAFVPFAISVSLRPTPHVPNGALSYACKNQHGRILKIPIADAKVSLQSVCRQKVGDPKVGFPKEFKPGYNQQLSAISQTGRYLIMPVNKLKYPNTFIVASDDCGLASVMMDNPPPIQQTERRPGLPENVRSVRTRLGPLSQPGGQSVATVFGSALQPCQMKAYDWSADVSGTGRSIDSIPVGRSRSSL